ncbi:MAG: CPXCG motif-containing cysteine-rich protein [Bacteroidota bacterium]
MFEHFFQCPYCWEGISFLLDTSVPQQTYVEECEVCCNPIEVSVRCTERELIDFQARELGQG